MHQVQPYRGESFNASARGQNVYGNHKSPSRDLAINFAHLQYIRNITHGTNGDGNSTLTFKLPQIQHYINGTSIRELYDREIYRPGTLHFGKLDFLREVQNFIGKQANLLFLTALLAHKKGQPHGDVMKALEEVVDVHFGTIKDTPVHPALYRPFPNSIPSLLMMAQINLHQGNPKLSMQSLEQALLSRHFEVQSFPLYHLVRARVVRAQENMAQAVASLKTATSLLTSSSKKQSPSLSIFSSSSSLLPPLTLGERLDVLTSASPRWDRRTWLTSSKNQSPSLHLLLLFLSPTSPNPWGEVRCLSGVGFCLYQDGTAGVC
ncbi:hypothetical protein EMCRGX_G004165 [Ephydatia muelleri]